MLLKKILEILVHFSCHSNPVTNKQMRTAVMSQLEGIQIPLYQLYYISYA